VAIRQMELSPGDVYWARPDLAPGGREQRGRRPVLVVSNDLYLSTATTLMLVVPLTTVDRGWDNHVRVDLATLADPTFAMTEQVRAMSRQRLDAPLGRVSPSALQAVRTWIGDYLASVLVARRVAD